MKPFIEVKNVWQEYGDQVVLERLNLSINEGEFCTLVGASGCGKSTFLRLLLGQERASRGEILLGGQPLADDEGRIAMVSTKDTRTGPRHVKWLQGIEVRKIVD